MAVDRARVLMGCYRKGDANDPEVYAAAAVAVLSRYPENVVIAATDPATGLPSRLKWLPAIAEIREACETEMDYLRRQLRRDAVLQENLRRREAEPQRLSASQNDALPAPDIMRNARSE